MIFLSIEMLKYQLILNIDFKENPDSNKIKFGVYKTESVKQTEAFIHYNIIPVINMYSENFDIEIEGLKKQLTVLYNINLNTLSNTDVYEHFNDVVNVLISKGIEVHVIGLESNTKIGLSRKKALDYILNNISFFDYNKFLWFLDYDGLESLGVKTDDKKYNSDKIEFNKLVNSIELNHSYPHICLYNAKYKIKGNLLKSFWNHLYRIWYLEKYENNLFIDADLAEDNVNAYDKQLFYVNDNKILAIYVDYNKMGLHYNPKEHEYEGNILKTVNEMCKDEKYFVICCKSKLEELKITDINLINLYSSENSINHLNEKCLCDISKKYNFTFKKYNVNSIDLNKDININDIILLNHNFLTRNSKIDSKHCSNFMDILCKHFKNEIQSMNFYFIVITYLDARHFINHCNESNTDLSKYKTIISKFQPSMYYTPTVFNLVNALPFTDNNHIKFKLIDKNLYMSNISTTNLTKLQFKNSNDKFKIPYGRTKFNLFNTSTKFYLGGGNLIDILKKYMYIIIIILIIVICCIIINKIFNKHNAKFKQIN